MRLAAAVLIACSTTLAAMPAQAASVRDVFARINEYLAPLEAELVGAVPGKTKSPMVSVADVALQAALGPPIALTDMLALSVPQSLPGDMLLVDQLGFLEFDRDFNGVHISFGNVNWQRLLLPPVGTTDPLVWAQLPGSVSIDNLVVEFGGKSFTVDNITLHTLPRPEVGTTDPTNFMFQLAVTGLLVNASVLDLVPSDFRSSMTASSAPRPTSTCRSNGT